MQLEPQLLPLPSTALTAFMQLHSGSGGAGCTPPHLRSLTPPYIHTYASVLDSIMRNSSGSSPIPRKSSNGSATLALFSSISHLSNGGMRLGRRHDRIDIDRHVRHQFLSDRKPNIGIHSRVLPSSILRRAPPNLHIRRPRVSTRTRAKLDLRSRYSSSGLTRTTMRGRRRAEGPGTGVMYFIKMSTQHFQLVIHDHAGRVGP
ncbi:hypothetical protein BD310DRAFT_936137 [Dichomitus squalens]|uniref:Uncharacterized protein n=1 Tax=Dichomitus squalens TaxID=114155 RepID=A0A4Q9PJQ3_9APHY|nr:hypothetical protein BD310DRAFT_936137 [Dichomitus squalens]